MPPFSTGALAAGTTGRGAARARPPARSPMGRERGETPLPDWEAEPRTEGGGRRDLSEGKKQARLAARLLAPNEGPARVR